eukprot:769880-Prorocentrum_minimum.AAC.1
MGPRPRYILWSLLRWVPAPGISSCPCSDWSGPHLWGQRGPPLIVQTDRPRPLHVAEGAQGALVHDCRLGRAPVPPVPPGGAGGTGGALLRCQVEALEGVPQRHLGMRHVSARHGPPRISPLGRRPCGVAAIV